MATEACQRSSIRSDNIETASPLGQLVRKFASYVELDDHIKAAILALPFINRSYRSASYIVREGDQFDGYCTMVLKGIVCRQKHTREGKRQIVSLHLAGDLLDSQQSLFKKADHNIQALTQVETVEIDRVALRALALQHSAVADAISVNALIEASMLREWVMSVGRRDARARVAHLLCEYGARMEANGVGGAEKLILPMTHEQIGDATGLTSVHVCRTLKVLTDGGAIFREGSDIPLSDWRRMRHVAEFSAHYLHLDKPLAAA